MDNTPPLQEPNGKFAKGNAYRFQKGNTVGRNSNAFASFQVRNRNIFRKYLTPEQMAEISKKVIQDAIDGNKQCQKLVFEYGLGKVTEINIEQYVEAIKIMSTPIDDILNKIMQDPDVRDEIRRKLSAFSVVDNVDAKS